MRRETQNILLVLLGGALLKISFTGTYLRYVKPSHQWLLITAGAIVVLLAVISIGRDLMATRAEAAATADPDADSAAPVDKSTVEPDESTVDGPDAAAPVAVRTAEPALAGHSHGRSSTSAWLLLLPVLAVFLVAPPALGADSVQRSAGSNRAAAAAEDGSAIFPALPAGDVIALPLSDFSARAAWDKGNSLNDRPILLTGFIVHESGATYVARLAIGCCAADAFPVKIKLDDAPDLAALPNDTWVEVVAILKPGTATRENDFVPTATVADAREIPQPEDPYEH